MAGLLKSLGFAPAGRHRNKAVTVWRQGDIRIVLNEETEGYAGAAFAARGTTVCDIGLDVADATAAVDRATALGAPSFLQPPGPGEMAIPAVRGLGGSILHFIDRTSGLADVWNVEFTPTGTADGDAGLRRVDHLAQTMSYDEMLSWTLFYTTLFQMGKSPMVDVIDPDGVVRSQAISDPDGQVRLTLNGAETHRTLAGSFLAESFGAPVQHIALATDDIFATASRLAALGFEALPVGPNYYDDLSARFGLSRDEVARLSAHDIFYDRDDGAGEYFQLYSRPFGGGMFFEIVERRGGYAGYGAPNAPFRIAAQKRLMRVKGMPSV